MDAIVARSMLKWPGVPAVYGWLRLDRRGTWRIRITERKSVFDPIGHAALNDFIARNYAADDRGCWYFQNGPQQVYVGLDYAPYVFRFEGRELVDHCGGAVPQVERAWLDEEGSLVVRGGGRVGLLDDRELTRIADDLASGWFPVAGSRLPLETVRSGDVEALFGFVREPGPPGQA